MPSNQKRTPLHYSRNKEQVEIDGDPKDVKPLVLLDLLFSKAKWIIMTIILVFVLPKASFIHLIIHWFKDKLFLIFLLVQVECLLRLSGQYFMEELMRITELS
jgi:hypothetical protein